MMISQLPAIEAIKHDRGRLTGVKILADRKAQSRPLTTDALAAAVVSIYVNSYLIRGGIARRIWDLENAVRLLMTLYGFDENFVDEYLQTTARDLVEEFENRVEDESPFHQVQGLFERRQTEDEQDRAFRDLARGTGKGGL